MGVHLGLFHVFAAGRILEKYREMLWRNRFPSAPFSKFQGPWTAIQVTVSKRLAFQNRSLLPYGVGKVAG